MSMKDKWVPMLDLKRIIIIVLTKQFMYCNVLFMVLYVPHTRGFEESCIEVFLPGVSHNDNFKQKEGNKHSSIHRL